jgi:hypothetical protein
MSEKDFTRWNKLLKEVHAKKLNSAERMKEKNNISVSADHPKGAAEPNKSVVSSELKNGRELETRNTKTVREIQTNIKNLWED